MNKLIFKWKDILLISGVDVLYWEDIANFFEKYANEDHIEGQNTDFNKFVITLHVLKKLDLSRVMFTERKDLCQCFKVSSELTSEQYQDIKFQIGIDIITMLESQMTIMVSNYLNKEIEENGGIAICGLFSTNIIALPSPDSFINSCLITSGYVLPFDVGRYKKLKKLKNAIYEKM